MNASVASEYDDHEDLLLFPKKEEVVSYLQLASSGSHFSKIKSTALLPALMPVSNISKQCCRFKASECV